MDDLKFEALFYEGEPNERLPEWNVIEWEKIIYKDDGSVVAKYGRKVWDTRDMVNGEALAVAKAKELNSEYYSRVNPTLVSACGYEFMV